ncbi:MAG: hypothetical protein NTV73_14425 [Hyphomicrobiales bacterium]|nr:hypothetical protein [Hyphomicrobiales bacterium]
MAAVLALFALWVSSGCQATSTGGSYRPANCAMVGSSCSRTDD